jgi:sigma54-dependent transcription regulator
MPEVLITWVGHTDLKAAGLMATREWEDPGLGPIAQATTGRRWDHVQLITNDRRKMGMDFAEWLKAHSDAAIDVMDVRLSSPTNFAEIYDAAVAAIARVVKTHGTGTHLTYHLSPGTPAMAAVWIILGKTLYPAALIQTSKEKGLEDSEVPFDLTAEYIPELLRPADDRLTRLAAGLAPESAEVKAILHRSAVMQKVVAQARRAAVRSVPVLLEGESGTGKELFARAIHAESPRRAKLFAAVNCGALTETLLESELFGHVRARAAIDQPRRIVDLT